MARRVKGFIVLHPGDRGALFLDIVLKPSVKPRGRLKDVLEEVRRCFYSAESCPYAQALMRRGYRYVASEDLTHIPSVNAGVIELVAELARHGFEVIYVDAPSDIPQEAGSRGKAVRYAGNS